MLVSSPRVSYTRNTQAATIAGLSGSASTREKTLVITVTNTDLTQLRESEITVRGAAIKSITATTLAAADPKAHNSFDDPRRVEPTESPVGAINGSTFVHSFAPASVTRLAVELS